MLLLFVHTVLQLLTVVFVGGVAICSDRRQQHDRGRRSACQRPRVSVGRCRRYASMVWFSAKCHVFICRFYLALLTEKKFLATCPKKWKKNMRHICYILAVSENWHTSRDCWNNVHCAFCKYKLTEL